MVKRSRSSSRRRQSTSYTSRSSRRLSGSKRSSRGSRRSSKKTAVNSSRKILKNLWSEYRNLYEEKRDDARHKKRRGRFFEAAVVVVQAISLTALILTIVVTAVKKSFQREQLIHVVWRGLVELILTVVVVATISHKRDALRSIIVALYLVAVIIDVFLLQRKMQGNYRFLCKPNDTNCLGFVGFRYDYMLNMLVCVVLHTFGTLFSTLAMNLHTEANWDSKSGDYMRMAIKKNRKLVKKQKRQIKRQAKKQRDSVHVISSSEFSSMSRRSKTSTKSRRSKTSTKSTRRSNSKRSSRTTPNNYV